MTLYCNNNSLYKLVNLISLSPVLELILQERNWTSHETVTHLLSCLLYVCPGVQIGGELVKSVVDIEAAAAAGSGGGGGGGGGGGWRLRC